MSEWNERQQALYDEIQKQRFYTIDSTGKTDTYVRAFVLLNNLAAQGDSRFLRNRIKKEFDLQKAALNLEAYATCEEELKAVYERHMEEFADRYVKICLADRAYGSTLWGLIPMPKKTVKNKLLNDIETVTYILPAKYKEEELFAPLRKYLLAAVEKADASEAEEDDL